MFRDLSRQACLYYNPILLTGLTFKCSHLTVVSKLSAFSPFPHCWKRWQQPLCHHCRTAGPNIPMNKELWDYQQLQYSKVTWQELDLPSASSHAFHWTRLLLVRGASQFQEILEDAPAVLLVLYVMVLVCLSYNLSWGTKYLPVCSGRMAGSLCKKTLYCFRSVKKK